MWRLENLIFDVSGVLLNDLTTVWKADSDAYEACGMDKIESIEKFKKSFRLPIYDYHRAMGVLDSQIPKIEAEYRKAYLRYDNLIQVFPEVKTVLQKLRQDKFVLAIASNIPSFFLEEHLRRFRINKFFDVVTGQEDSTEQKPSPQPILVTLRKLGASPERSAYIGDMEEDIIAGKRAHVITVAVSRPESYHPAWRLKRQNPDFLISDLNELITVVSKLNLF